MLWLLFFLVMLGLGTWGFVLRSNWIKEQAEKGEKK